MTATPFYHISPDKQKVVINNDSFPIRNSDEIKTLINEVMSDKFNLNNTDKNNLLEFLRFKLK